MLKYTYEKARADSLLKWKWMVEHGNKQRDSADLYYKLLNLPEFRMLRSGCGFCHFYKLNCHNCVLPNCLNDENGIAVASAGAAQDTLFNKWRESPSKDNAQAMLDLILSTPTKEPLI